MGQTEYTYADYRKHVEELAFKKKQLEDCIAEAKKAHAEYRRYRQIYADKIKEKNTRIQELMDLVPNKF